MTVGLVSRYRIIPESETLDIVGGFGRSVRDVAVVLDVIAGVDRERLMTADFGSDLR